MNTRTLATTAAATALLALLPLAASAQALSWKLSCQNVGSSPPEPMGDREGHNLSTGGYSCRTEGGPMDGAIVTGHSVWEWDKGSAVRAAGYGVYRKPGAMVVYQHVDGQFNLVTGDGGKVTGWTATGSGPYTSTAGAGSVLKGKKFSFSARSTAPGQFTVDVKAE